MGFRPSSTQSALIARCFLHRQDMIQAMRPRYSYASSIVDRYIYIYVYVGIRVCMYIRLHVCMARQIHALAFHDTCGQLGRVLYQSQGCGKGSGFSFMMASGFEFNPETGDPNIHPKIL